jgi:transcriptional regulator with XRE-family HTH domain
MSAAIRSTQGARCAAGWHRPPLDLRGDQGARGPFLRQLEQATDRAVSNAYLSQLETGKIRKPSPSVLHSLARIYAVPCEALMEKAGYLLPAEGSSPGSRRRLAIFAIDDLTAGEEAELLKYLAFIRSRNRTPRTP